MTWNYRIGTEIYNFTLGGEEHSERVFSVITVWYENEKPVSYSGKHPITDDYTNYLSFSPDIDGLKFTIDKIRQALNKPIFDLDNFPNEYKHESI